MKETDPQAPSKLKLQLFPINEATRKALEKVVSAFASKLKIIHISPAIAALDTAFITGYLANCYPELLDPCCR